MRKIIALGIALTVMSCGSGKKNTAVVEDFTSSKGVPFNELQTEVEKIVSEANQKTDVDLSDTTLGYIKAHAAAAMSEMRRTKVPASISLIQGILESDKGKNKLAKETNNHFGIFCGRGWKGERYYKNKEVNGECYRKYNYAVESYKDHSTFLVRRPKYASLFSMGSYDYKKWAKELQKVGYSSDPSYAEKIIDQIEKYDLYKFDEVVLKGMVGRYQLSEFYTKKELVRDSVAIVQKTQDSIKQIKIAAQKVVADSIAKQKAIQLRELKRQQRVAVKKHVVAKNETLYGISRQYGLNVAYVKSFNGLTSDAIRVGDVLKIKQHVKREGYHIVKKDETMFFLSKKYKISIKQLKKLNSLSSNMIFVGQELKVK